MKRTIEDNDIPTACTDGIVIRFNKAYAESIGPALLMSLYIHELFHIIKRHFARMGNRNIRLWNIATDYLINWEIKHMLNLPIGNDWLYNEAYSPKTYTSEKLYEELLKKEKEDRQIIRPGQMIVGEVEKPENPQEVEQVVIRQTAAAYQQAKAAGKAHIPDWLAKEIEDILRPKINPKSILRNILTKKIRRRNYTWARPNKRYQEIYMPRTKKERMFNIVVAVDTSGSIDYDQLREWCGIVEQLYKAENQIETTLIYCDAAIQKIDTFKRPPINVQKIQGGGTAYAPVFRWVRENKPDADAIIYFGDMATWDWKSVEEAKPSCPTIWVTKTKKHNAPFGKTINYE